MDPQAAQLDTTPPWGNADAANGIGGFSSFGKLIFIQFVQGRIAQMKIRFLSKINIYLLIFAAQLYMNTQNFVQNRPQTLYDIF